MSKEEKKLQSNGAYELNDGRKQAVHKELLPIQSDIMSILLFDLDKGTELLQRYRLLIQQFDEKQEVSMSTMGELVNLERDVNSIKQSASQTKIDAYEVKCNELLEGLNSNTIEQTHRSLENLKESFENRIGEFSLSDINRIQNVFASVRFFVIREKRKEFPYLDLQEEISEDEVKGLESIFSYQVIQLLNSSKPRIQDMGKRIKDDLALVSGGKDSVVYDSSIWDKFGSIPMLPQEKSQMTENRKDKKENKSLALVVRKPSIWERITSKFRGIGKTEIEKLADEVVTQDMLDAYIDFSKPEGQRYIPDKRLPVYDFLKKMYEEKEKWEKRLKRGKCSREAQWNFESEGKEFSINLREIREDNSIIESIYATIKALQGEKTIRKYEYYVGSDYISHITTVQFAKLLGIDEQVKQLLGTLWLKAKTSENGLVNDYALNNKYITKLQQRLKKVMAEYQQTQFEFYTTEDARKAEKQTECDKRKKFIQELPKAQEQDIKPLGGEGPKREDEGIQPGEGMQLR